MLTVQLITDELFTHFNAADAEPWDKVGLLVGDPQAAVSKVGVALDPTVEAIERARLAGCEALVTHHPVALDLTFPFVPQRGGGAHPQAAIFHAIEHDVALIAMHTNLDRSPAAGAAVADLFDLTIEGVLEKEEQAPGCGRLGQICTGRSFSVKKAAEIIGRIYQSTSRVFYAPGTDDTTSHERITLLSGSFSSSFITNVLDSQATLVITGEMGYHSACDLQSAGVTSLLIGHDVSELIYTQTLTHALSTIGASQLEIVDCDEGVRWHTV